MTNVELRASIDTSVSRFLGFKTGLYGIASMRKADLEQMEKAMRMMADLYEKAKPRLAGVNWPYYYVSSEAWPADLVEAFQWYREAQAIWAIGGREMIGPTRPHGWPERFAWPPTGEVE